MHRQPCKDVLEIDVGIVAVHLGRLNQAHDGGGAAAGSQRAREQPIVTVMPKMGISAVMASLQLCRVPDTGPPLVERPSVVGCT